jgi:hypothetical protein
MRSCGSRGEVVHLLVAGHLVREPTRTRCRLVAAIISVLLKIWHHGSGMPARDAAMGQIASVVVRAERIHQRRSSLFQFAARLTQEG